MPVGARDRALGLKTLPIPPNAFQIWQQMGPLGPFVAQIWPLAAQRPQIHATRCAPARYLVAVSVPFDGVALRWAIWGLF